MLYVFIKFIHILSSTVLFGTGLGTASVMMYGYLLKNMHTKLAMYDYVVKVDWFFTGLSGLVQLLTGLTMVYLAGFSLHATWLYWSIIGYSVAAVAWFGAVYFQIKVRNITRDAIQQNIALPADYYRYFRYWFIVGWPAFLSLVGVFYLMTVKP